MANASEAHGQPTSKRVVACPDLSNTEFRQLLDRFHNADDHEAGEVLYRYLSIRIIYPKVRTLPVDKQADATQNMIETAWKAGHSAMTKVVRLPRNYVVRAITLSFRSELRKLQREKALESVPLDVELEDRCFEQIMGPRDELLRFISEIGASGTTGEKVADVLELCCYLGLTQHEACELMNFSQREHDTVTRTIRRWRQTPGSPLSNLIAYLCDAEGDR